MAANKSGFGQAGGWDAVGGIVGAVTIGLLQNQQAKKERQFQQSLAEKQLAIQKELGLAEIKARVDIEKQQAVSDPSGLRYRAGTRTAGMGGNMSPALIIVFGVGIIGAISFAVYQHRKKQ